LISSAGHPNRASAWRTTMDKGIKRGALAGLALLIGLMVAAPAQAADPIEFGRVVADDQDVAMLIKYHGPAAAGYVTVSAAGDLTFEITDTSTVDTSLECDASIAADGSRSGIYDVSVAACDTLGEVCDLINTQAEEWACVILDGFRSDTPGPSGTGFILAASDQPAKVAGGYGVKWDTSAALTSTHLIAPPAYRKIETYYNVPAGGASKSFNTSGLFTGTPTLLVNQVTETYGSGTSFWRIYEVELTPSRTLGASAETSTVFLGPITGPATTETKSFLSGFEPFGLPLPRNRKMIARVTNSAALGTVTNILVGRLQPDDSGGRAVQGR
jgi:hypothetical protein